jgi:chromosome segregation ATPase
VLQPFDHADRERPQFQFQVSQLRAKLQQQAEVEPTLTGIAPDPTPLLTGSDGTRWQTAIAQLQAETEAEIAKTRTDAIAPLNQTVQAQQQELQHLQATLTTLQGQLQGYDQAIQDYQEQAIALPEQLAAMHTLVQTRLEHLKTQLTQQVLSEALATQHQELLGDVARQMTQAQMDNQQQVGQLRDRLDRLQSQWQQNLQRLQTQSEIHHNQWQTQKIEVATQLAQFDTMAERFQQMEAQITQLQQAIARLGRPSAAPMRHTNTVYTRYQ